MSNINEETEWNATSISTDLMNSHFEILRSYYEWLLVKLGKDDEEIIEFRSYCKEYDNELKKKIQIGEESEESAKEKKGFNACLNIDELKKSIMNDAHWKDFKLDISPSYKQTIIENAKTSNENVAKLKKEILDEFKRMLKLNEVSKD